MFKVRCIHRTEELTKDITIGADYYAIDIKDDYVLIINNVNKVEWYPMYYFKIV